MKHLSETSFIFRDLATTQILAAQTPIIWPANERMKCHLSWIMVFFSSYERRYFRIFEKIWNYLYLSNIKKTKNTLIQEKCHPPPPPRPWNFNSWWLSISLLNIASLSKLSLSITLITVSETSDIIKSHDCRQGRWNFCFISSSPSLLCFCFPTPVHFLSLPNISLSAIFCNHTTS